MRIYLPLWRQNISRMITRHWDVQRNRKILDTKHAYYLNKFDIPILDANEFVTEKKTKTRVKIVKEKDLQTSKQPKTLYHTLSEDDVLLEGLNQALNITKTVHVAETMPSEIEKLTKENLPDGVHNLVEKAIMTANIFDSEQKKLYKLDVPGRPGVKTPNIYGVTSYRKMFITTNLLLNAIERNSFDTSNDRYISHDMNIMSVFQKDKNSIQIKSPSNILITSKKPLGPVNHEVESTEGIDLPNLYPLNYLVSMTEIYKHSLNTVYPLVPELIKTHCPHTTILFYDPRKVANLYEKPVTETQIFGRALTHSFSLANSFARTIYDENTKELPTPLTVQCVQTDGQNFYFSIFQLNTLDLNGTEGVKNMLYSLPAMKLFKTCTTIEGRHVYEGYNKNIINYLNAFYNNS